MSQNSSLDACLLRYHGQREQGKARGAVASLARRLVAATDELRVCGKGQVERYTRHDGRGMGLCTSAR
jgi:hypothetical protein